MRRPPTHPERAILAALLRDSSRAPWPLVRRDADLESEVRHIGGGNPVHRRVLDILLDLPPGTWKGRAARGVAALLHDGVPVASRVQAGARGEADDLPPGRAEAFRALAKHLPSGARLQAPDLTAHERLLLAPWAEHLVEVAAQREVRVHRHGRALVLVLHGPRDPEILLLLPA